VVEVEAVIAAYGQGDDCGIVEATVADEIIMKIENTLSHGGWVRSAPG